jgi:formylglycine-generating enzyme required for sulfatase activity
MARNPAGPRSSAADAGVIEAGSIVDGFRVLRPLAEGAMGRLFLAQDLALGRLVALKFLRPELLGADSAERLLDEARTTARFNHPNIVTVHVAGTFQGQPYLAMEYLEGENLRQRMGRERMSVGEVLMAGRAIADALAEAHRHGIIHADLKPENVLLPRDGRLRVVDFGLARHAGAQAGAASGTPAYMSPERWQGAAPEPAMDVWALGVLMHELLEGQRPVDDADLAAFAFKPRPLPGPSDSFAGAALVKACLAVKPSERPTAEQVAQSLAALLEPGQPPPGDETRSPFRGLRAFTEADAGDFSGREAEVDALVERLRHDGLVALVGPSGIGKSSLLHAGLVPRLRQLAPWTVVALRPGSHPLRRLAEVLGLGPEAAAKWAGQPGSVVEPLRARGPAPGLLSVDAFEEAFTLAPPEETLALARCLAAVATADLGWRVVLTLRDDYLGHFARLEPLRPFLGSAFVVGPLSASALVEATAGPLRRAGYGTDDPALVGRIVADVQAQPAGLPLLQATCAALWEQRDKERRLLRAAVYEELGGVAGALAAQGRRLLGQLPADEVRTVRVLLLRLLTPEGTRHPRQRAELLEGLGESAGPLLDAMVEHRLVVASRDLQTDGATVEVAHEALATAWPELARWREESREEHLLVQEIDQASALWDRRGRRDEETWGGAALAQAVRRVEDWKVPLASRSRAFLEAARLRERAQVRRRRVLLSSAVALLAVAALTATGAALAFRQKQLEAVRQQSEIRLAAADVGAFELVLEVYDFDPRTQAWTRVPAQGALAWSLSPVEGLGAGEPYDGGLIQRDPGRVDEQGAWREHVQAPSREAWLIVKRGGCPPSRVRLQRLPGYEQREQHREVRIPVPTCAASRVGMIEVPAGPYYRPTEVTGESLRVDVASFSIDKTEATNGQFKLFQEKILPLSGDERMEAPPHKLYALAHAPESPATGFDAFTAEAFCHFLGKVLPTMDEWMKAARGGEFLSSDRTVLNPNPTRRSVWGDERPRPPANLENNDPFPTVAPVGSFPEDRSPYGILDMGGNVAEWTATPATESSFQGLRIVLGGRWDGPVATGQHLLDWTNNLPPRRFEFGIGVRCVERPLN